MTRTDRQATSSDSMSWAVIAALVTGVLAVEVAWPMAIEPRSLLSLALACTALCSTAVFYSRVRIDARFSACCLGLAQALLFSVVGSILSYLLARSSVPLQDSALAGSDRALGLDWIGYAHFVDAHTWLVRAYRVAYSSLIPQTIVVILALGFGRMLDDLRQFVLAAILTGTASVLIAAQFPALGAFAHYGLKPTDFSHVWQATGLADLRDFLAVRSGRLTVLDLRKMQGIVTFPSYHAALALVALRAFWKSGLRWLRWSGTALAAVTIAATPIDGGHYFVDVIGGLAIAVASIAAANRLVFVRLPSPAIRAWPSRRSRAAFAR
jgi:membrane-associated phospholipid phosphatase